MTVDDQIEQVRADERKIKQVILNLRSNAIKFTPDGGRIEVRAKPVDGFVEVSLTDTGVGIAPEDQEAIFEEFKQVGTAAKKVRRRARVGLVAEVHRAAWRPDLGGVPREWARRLPSQFLRGKSAKPCPTQHATRPTNPAWTAGTFC
jgi:light-regulated signal transduction histidine kinase (bacteriophytochrome)